MMLYILNTLVSMYDLAIRPYFNPSILICITQRNVWGLKNLKVDGPCMHVPYVT